MDDRHNPHKEHTEILRELTENLKDDVARGLKLLDSCVTQIAQAKWILTQVNSTVDEYSKEKTCPVCSRRKSKSPEKYKKANGSVNPVPKNLSPPVVVTKASSPSQRPSPNNIPIPPKSKPYKAGPLSQMRKPQVNGTGPTPMPCPAKEQPKLPKTLSIILSQTNIKIPLPDIRPLIRGEPTIGIRLSDIDTSGLMNLPERPRNLNFRANLISPSKKPMISKVSGNMKNKPVGLASKRFLESLNDNSARDRAPKDKDGIGKKYLTPAIVVSDSDSSSSDTVKKAKATSQPMPLGPPKPKLKPIVVDDSSDSDFVKPKSKSKTATKKFKHKKSNSSDSSSMDSPSDSSDSEDEKFKKKPKKPVSTKMKITIKNESVKFTPSSSSHSSSKKVAKDKDKEKEKKDKHHHRERSNSATSSSHNHKEKKDKSRERDREKDKNKDKDKERKTSTDSRKHRERERKHSTDKKEKPKHRSRSRSKDRSISKSSSISEKSEIERKPVKRERSSSVESNATEFVDLNKTNPLFDSLLKSKNPINEVEKTVIPMKPIVPPTKSVEKLSGDSSKSEALIAKPKPKVGPASMMKSVGQSISNELNRMNKSKESQPLTAQVKEKAKENDVRQNLPAKVTEDIQETDNQSEILDSKSDTGRSDLSIPSVTTSVTSTMNLMKRKLCANQDDDETPVPKKPLGDNKSQLKAKLESMEPEARAKFIARLKMLKERGKAGGIAKGNNSKLIAAPKSTTSECKSTVSETKSTLSTKNDDEQENAIEPGDDVISKCLALANVEEEEVPPPQTPTTSRNKLPSLKFEIKTPPDLQDCISPTGVSKFFGTNRLSTDSNSNPEP